MKRGKKREWHDKDFKNLEKKLDDQKFVARVLRKVQLKRQQMTLVVKISELKERLKTAKGRQKARIENAINILEKAKEIGKRAFFEK